MTYAALQPACRPEAEFYGYTATLLRDGRVLIDGGSTEDFQPLSAQVWDPATASFSLTGSPGEQRLWGHSATLLADGRVLIGRHRVMFSFARMRPTGHRRDLGSGNRVVHAGAPALTHRRR